MAQLALITAKTYNENVNNIGDIVGVYPDDWKFTDKEKDLFDIIKVSESKEIVEAKIPITKRLTKAATTDWTDQEPERKEVWQGDDKKYRDIVINPKYKLCVDKGIVKETYSKSVENLAIITDISVMESK